MLSIAALIMPVRLLTIISISHLAITPKWINMTLCRTVLMCSLTRMMTRFIWRITPKMKTNTFMARRVTRSMANIDTRDHSVLNGMDAEDYSASTKSGALARPATRCMHGHNRHEAPLRDVGREGLFHVKQFRHNSKISDQEHKQGTHGIMPY